MKLFLYHFPCTHAFKCWLCGETYLYTHIFELLIRFLIFASTFLFHQLFYVIFTFILSVDVFAVLCKLVLCLLVIRSFGNMKVKYVAGSTINNNAQPCIATHADNQYDEHDVWGWLHWSLVYHQCYRFPLYWSFLYCNLMWQFTFFSL